jgi:hypothetical protein
VLRGIVGSATMQFPGRLGTYTHHNASVRGLPPRAQHTGFTHRVGVTCWAPALILPVGRAVLIPLGAAFVADMNFALRGFSEVRL